MIKLFDPTITGATIGSVGAAIAEQTPLTLGIAATCCAVMFAFGVWKGASDRGFKELSAKMDQVLNQIQDSAHDVRKIDHRLTHLEAGCQARHGQQMLKQTQRIEIPNGN